MSSSPTENPIIITAAAPGDIPAMLELFDCYAQRQLMLPRTAEDLAANIGNFIVAKDSQSKLVGAVALRPYEHGFFEVRSLAVADGNIGCGIGTRLVSTLLEKAKALIPPASCVFVFTKRPNLFLRLGFTLTERQCFSDKILADCLQCPKYHQCDEIALEFPLPAAAN